MDGLMIIGADRLGAIPDRLKELGFQDIKHVSGRKVKMVQKEIPPNIDLVLVLTVGNGARQIFKADVLPIRSVVVGVVDELHT